MYRKRARVRDVWWDYSPRRGGSSGSSGRLTLPDRNTAVTEPQDNPNPNPNYAPELGEPVASPVSSPGPITGPQIVCTNDSLVFSDNLLRGIGSTHWWDSGIVPPSLSVPIDRYTNGIEAIEGHPNRWKANDGDEYLEYQLPRTADVDEIRVFFSTLAISDTWADVQAPHKINPPYLDNESRYGPTADILVQFLTPVGNVEYEVKMGRLFCEKNPYSSFSATARLPFPIVARRVRFWFQGNTNGLCEIELHPKEPGFIGVVPPPTYNLPLGWTQEYAANNPSPVPTIAPNALTGATLSYIDPLTGEEFPAGNKNNPSEPLTRLNDLDPRTAISITNLAKNITAEFPSPIDIRGIRVWCHDTAVTTIGPQFDCDSILMYDADKVLLETYTPGYQDFPGTIVGDIHMYELKYVADPTAIFAGGIKYVVFVWGPNLPFREISQVEII